MIDSCALWRNSTHSNHYIYAYVYIYIYINNIYICLYICTPVVVFH